VTSEPVLDTGLGTYDVDTHLLAGGVDALERCAAACVTCADLCIVETPGPDHVTCIRRCWATAELCHALATIVARDGAVEPAILRLVLEGCRELCESTAAECDRHDADHCRECAELCRRCVSACAALEKELAAR
jgi:hypothetical protein